MYDHMTSPVNINGTVTTPPRSSVASGTCTTEFTITVPTGEQVRCTATGTAAMQCEADLSDGVPASFSGEMTWAPTTTG